MLLKNARPAATCASPGGRGGDGSGGLRQSRGLAPSGGPGHTPTLALCVCVCARARSRQPTRKARERATDDLFPPPPRTPSLPPALLFSVISPDFSLESTGFFPGKHLIPFLVVNMKDYRNSVLDNCIIISDAEQVYLKLRATNLNLGKKIGFSKTLNPKP